MNNGCLTSSLVQSDIFSLHHYYSYKSFEYLQHMQQIKQVNQFINGNKSREKTVKQMAPLIEKIQAEFSIVLSEARFIKQKTNQVLKFQSEKLTLQKYIKDVRRDLYETNINLASVKADSELGCSMLSSSISTMKDEVHSLQRTMNRRQQYFHTYDKKLNSIIDTISKHQGYINDKMLIFQQKFKQLTKQTLQITKQIRRDFDKTISSNINLKNQLTHKIKNTQDKEKILDLYMSQRQEAPKKIQEIKNEFNNFLRNSEFEEFKRWHEIAIQENFTKVKKIIGKQIPVNARQNLMKIEGKFAEIDILMIKSNEINQVKEKLQEVRFKVEVLQKKQENQLIKLRQETEEMQQKMIEVIDRKIETIQVQIEKNNVQNEQSVQQKFNKMKQQLLIMISQKYDIFDSIDESSFSKTIQNHQEGQNSISRELEAVKKERQLTEIHSQQIKAIADSINGKLSLFSNRITMCKSDMEIFVESTTRQLKKILDVRREEQSHMQLVGRMFADLLESVLILTSLTLSADKKGQAKSYVTYNDGIILELNNQASNDMISYRKSLIATYDLKQSLVISLIGKIDQLITSQPIFKWDKYKPSSFFHRIKQSLNSQTKGISKSLSVNLHSPKRRKTKNSVDQQLVDLNIDSRQLLISNIQKPTITINNSHLMWTCQKPKSEMHKRYKIKRSEQKGKKQGQERNCFTASRSHRKTKILFN